jgi:hypothetical protein
MGVAGPTPEEVVGSDGGPSIAFHRACQWLAVREDFVATTRQTVGDEP